MWADKKSMVKDGIEELLDPDMEPKRESLWWTSTHRDEDVATLQVGSIGKPWNLPFKEEFDVLVIVSTVMGRGFKPQKRR